MNQSVLSALKFIKWVGLLLLGTGSALFFAWLILFIIEANTKVRTDFDIHLKMLGFLYVAFSTLAGILLAVYFLYLHLTYYSKSHPEAIKKQFREAALFLFINIPAAIGYLALFSSIEFPPGD